jgi:NADP-dependent 3-hydroxy acid dehydrogenase YdfG
MIWQMSISGSIGTNKTWFITGTSSGLGRTMTERLLDRGDRVAATVRRDDALADLQQKHLERLSVMKLDLTDSIGIRSTKRFDA